MTKSIRSYPKGLQYEVIKRRLSLKVKGLGYWSAVDAQKYVGKAG